MAELANALRVLIEQIILTFGYPGIALVMFLENFFPPLPSEMMMVFSGFLVSEGRLSLPGVLLAGVTGMIVGAVAVYYSGRWLDERVIRVLVRRYGRWVTLSETELDRALGLVNRHGAWLVMFGRFVPVLRALIALPAGISRMPLRRFLFFLTLGAWMYNSVQVIIGMILGENWPSILSFIDQYEGLLVMIGTALAIAGVTIWLVRWRAQTQLQRIKD